MQWGIKAEVGNAGFLKWYNFRYNFLCYFSASGLKHDTCKFWSVWWVYTDYVYLYSAEAGMWGGTAACVQHIRCRQGTFCSEEIPYRICKAKLREILRKTSWWAHHEEVCNKLDYMHTSSSKVYLACWELTICGHKITWHFLWAQDDNSNFFWLSNSSYNIVKWEKWLPASSLTHGLLLCSCCFPDGDCISVILCSQLSIKDF